MQDRTLERVTVADAYQQEGPMTTFFRTAGQRRTVDSWSVRVASFRTADILIVRRVEDSAGLGDGIEAVPEGLRAERPRRSA